MASSDEGQGGSAHPSFETLRDTLTPIRILPHCANRLFWCLDGPLATAVSIMENPWSPDSREPYFQQTTSGGTWHRIAMLPLTEPKISSITVHVYELDMWDEFWMDMHRDHSDPDDGDENGDDVLYGELPDYDSDVDEEGPLHLLVCCGSQRPRGKAVSIEVKPSLGGENSFVTVHDYLSTVHPRLMSIREDILGAMGLVKNGCDEPLAQDAEVMVLTQGFDSLMMNEKAMWIQHAKSSEPVPEARQRE